MISICPNCSSAIRIVDADEPTVRHVIFDDATCHACGTLVSLLQDKQVPPEVLASPKTLNMPLTEAFCCLYGGGLKSERHASVSHVQKSVVGKRVASIELENTQVPDRCVVRKIVFEDGGAIYLSASILGATVYRVIPPKEEACP